MLVTVCADAVCLVRDASKHPDSLEEYHTPAQGLNKLQSVTHIKLMS